LIRRRPTDPLPPPPESLTNEFQLPNQELLLSWAVQQRPDISAAAARVEAEQAKWSLACKEYYPDVELFGRYDKFWQPTDTQSDLQGQIGVRVNVPIYRGRLNAAVSEAMHQFMKARAEYDQLVLDAQSEVQSTYEQVRESQRTVALYSQKLIPAAEQNVAVAHANYDVSKINFLDLAIAQRQLIEARDRQLQAQVELQRRTASLRRSAGGSLPEVPLAADQFQP
jgi:outer membrane protein TolC